MLVPWHGLGSLGVWSVDAQIRRQKKTGEMPNAPGFPPCFMAPLKAYTGPKRDLKVAG